MEKTNRILSDEWTYLRVDISTPKYPNSVMLIDIEDWEYLQKVSSLGRIRAMNWRTYSSIYPGVKLRGRVHSVLYILFRSPRGVKTISDNWLDIRRSNLTANIPSEDLKHPGEPGFRKLKAYKPPTGVVNNKILDRIGPDLILDTSTDLHPDQSIRVRESDFEDLKTMGVGRIFMKPGFNDVLIPTCRFQGSHRPVYKVMHGHNITYRTKDVLDLRIENMKEKKKKCRAT